MGFSQKRELRQDLRYTEAVLDRAKRSLAHEKSENSKLRTRINNLQGHLDSITGALAAAREDNMQLRAQILKLGERPSEPADPTTYDPSSTPAFPGALFDVETEERKHVCHVCHEEIRPVEVERVTTRRDAKLGTTQILRSHYPSCANRRLRLSGSNSPE